MPEVKLDGKLTTNAYDALIEHARPMYDRLGAARMGIVELRSIERTTPGPTEDRAPAVKFRVVGLEIAGPDQEGAVREAQRALYIQRTATGTLDDDGQIELDKDTLRLTGRLLHEIETARLRAALHHWSKEARKVVNSAILTDGEIRHELDRIAQGLHEALHPAEKADGGEE